MILWRLPVLVIPVLLGAASPAAGCGASLKGGPSQSAASERYIVAWTTQPVPAPLGKHFAVEVEVCPKGGAKAPEALGVDAHMPDHRHGMNYRPKVTSQGRARYRAEGLLFHMPGRWEYIFEVHADGRTDRITAVQTIE